MLVLGGAFTFAFYSPMIILDPAGSAIHLMTLLLAPTRTEVLPSLNPWMFPARQVSVFYGSPRLPRLSHYFLPRVLLNDESVLFLDGANQFDPLLLARFARRRGLEASFFNRLMRVSRAFTCFQLTELIARTPKFLNNFPAKVLIVTALPDLYFDEDVREREARVSFEHALEGLQRIVRGPIAVAVFSDATSFHTGRRDLFQQLCKQADQLLKIETRPNKKLVFTCEKAAPQLSV
jgi:hypothetical protein